MSNNTVDIGKWLKDGFTLYKTYPVLLFVSTFLAAIIGIFTFGILLGPLFVGLYAILLRLIDSSDPAPKIEDVFKRFDKFVPALLFVIVVALVNWIGSFILSLVPGVGGILQSIFSLVWMTLTLLGLPLIADRGLDFIPALTTSIEAIKPNLLPWLGFALVAGLIGASGALALGFGVILTAPFYFAAVASAYRDTFPKAFASGTTTAEPDIAF